MRYLTTLMLAVCMSINSMAGVVGTLVVCFHKDCVHINLSSRHSCINEDCPGEPGIGGKRINLNSKCVDILIESEKSPKIAAKTLKISHPQTYSHPIPPSYAVFDFYRISEHASKSLCFPPPGWRPRENIPLII